MERTQGLYPFACYETFSLRHAQGSKAYSYTRLLVDKCEALSEDRHTGEAIIPWLCRTVTSGEIA